MADRIPPMAQDPRDADEPAGAWRVAKQAADLAVSLMFACVFAVFMYKIALRYAAGDAVAWADEISVILFIWMVFCANAFVISERRQIRFDLVYRMLPAPGRRAAAIVRLLIVGGLFLWALPGVIDYLQFLWRERTPALGLRLDFVYSCFGIFVAAIVLRSAWGIVTLLRSHWRRHI